jgi:hypothetical protein
MADPDRRESSLDLTEEDLRTLLAGVTALGEQELAAAGPGRCSSDRPLPWRSTGWSAPTGRCRSTATRADVERVLAVVRELA